jgi:hypothetical protein
MPSTNTATSSHPVTIQHAADHAADLADRAQPDPDSGLAGVADLLTAIDRLLAIVVTVLIQADHRTVIATEGLTTASWLRAIARRTGADAGTLLAAADRLADMPATLTAFQTGVISWGTVRGIVAAARSLTSEQRTWLDESLTADADRLARVDGDTIADDAHVLADRARPDLHQARADRAAAQHLVLQPSVDGTGGTIFAALDAESFAAVTAAIDGIARDGTGRRVASNVDALRALARHRVTLTTDTDTDDADGNDPASSGTDDETAAATDHGTTGDSPDTPPRPVRPAPSTARPEVIVVTDIRMLTDPDTDPVGSGVARLLWRHDRPAPRLTRHAARRLACDATWRPVLVDEHGRVLGTAEPYAKVSTALRAALAARDGGCRFPACHAPVEVCDAHHLQHRADGGPTVMSNLALLCSAHHQAVHEGGWHPSLDTATGAMTFTRRHTTLHSHPRLPATPRAADAGPPPTGRPRRRTSRARPPDERPPTERPPHPPPGSPLSHRAPAEPLPF